MSDLHTVLLAEQHLPTLEHLTGALSQAGYKVVAVSEPGAAIERFTSENPAIVVVAVDFPKIGGVHLGALIRSRESGGRTPIIAIDKGHLGKAKGIQAVLDLKVNAYVADPMKGNELIARLQALQGGGTTAPKVGGLLAVLQRPPIVAGDLVNLNLPALWVSLFQLRRSGVLVVALRELSRRVFFLEGKPVAYDSTARQDGFPMYLVARGELSEADAATVFKSIAEGVRVGVALATVPGKFSGEDLLQRLRDYTRERCAQLLGMREGRFTFHLGDEYVSSRSPVEVPALGPILEGARRSFPIKLFARSLRDYLQSFPVRTPQFASALPALGLSTQDLKQAMQLNGRLRLDELIAHGRNDLSLAYSLFWYLLLVEAVEFHSSPLPSTSSGPATADRLAPKRRKPLPTTTLEGLREGAVKIITASYFRGLGLEITAGKEEVERAYQEIAAKFHPDTYAEFDLSELQDLLESVQDRLLASYRVLSVETKRKAYLQFLLSRLDIGRAAEINVESEIALKRGEAALRRKDFRAALTAYEEAVAKNPREPEYYSYLAWATYQGAGGPRPERAKAALKLLKKALALNPSLERANVIHAIIEAEQGELVGARRRLLKVLELDPTSKLAKAALRKVGR